MPALCVSAHIYCTLSEHVSQDSSSLNKDFPCLFSHCFPHPHLLPSITSMAFQTLFFTFICPSFLDVPMVVQPQAHPCGLILDHFDFLKPPINLCLGS